jgi:hypothetical protein
MKYTERRASCYFPAWLTLRPEDGRDMFLRNVDYFSLDYTALYPRIHNTLIFLAYFCVLKINLWCVLIHNNVL